MAKVGESPMKGVYWIHPGFRAVPVQLLPGSLRELGKRIVHVSFETEENSRNILGGRVTVGLAPL